MPQGQNDQVKFATYTRDAVSGLDYAVNRHYAYNSSRFLSPDPNAGSGGPTLPQSWNRYSYVQGDPINNFDRWGLDDQPVNAPPTPGPACGDRSGFSTVSYTASTSNFSGGFNMFNCFVGYVMDWSAFSIAQPFNVFSSKSWLNTSVLVQFSQPDLAYAVYNTLTAYSWQWGLNQAALTFIPPSWTGYGNPSILASLAPPYYGGSSTLGDAYGQSPSGPPIKCPAGQYPVITIFPSYYCAFNATGIPAVSLQLPGTASSTGTGGGTTTTGTGGFAPGNSAIVYLGPTSPVNVPLCWRPPFGNCSN